MLRSLRSQLLIGWIRSREHPMKLRLLRYAAYVTGNGPVTVAYLCGTRIRVQPNDYIGYKIIRSGVYEPDLYNLICSTLDSSSTFVDVGCHIGSVTLPLATKCQRVFALDANPAMIQLLLQTIKLNGLNNVRLFSTAVSDQDGTADFYLANSANTGTSSLRRGWPHGPKLRQIRVPCTTLATWAKVEDIGRIDCLKIDAEGATGAIIRGAKSILHNIRAVIAEDSPDIQTAINLLGAAGFEVSRPLQDSMDEESAGTILAINQQLR